MRALTVVVLLTVAGCGGGGSGGATGPEAPPPTPPPPPSAPPPILPPVTPAWHVPACSSVTGAPVTFTSDGGLTRAPIERPAASDYFTYGVAALNGGSTLAAVVGTRTFGNDAELYFSTDAGCSWQPSGQVFPHVSYYLDAMLTPAGAHAYVWGQSEFVYIIEPTGVARPFNFESFPWWVSGPYGLGIDPQNPARVRIALYDCASRASCGHGSDILETTNEGATWTQVGTPVPNLGLPVRFSPTNLDHAISPMGVAGSEFYDAAGYITFDGNNSWLSGRGLPAGWATDEVAVGPDGQTVWLLAHTGSYPSPPLLSAMYVSHDGGLNYQEAFAASDENPFASSAPYGDPIPHARIFTHPSDADVVYLAYTSRATATSYLFRYDADLDELTKREWPSSEGGVWSLTFNPSNPEHLYLGLAAAD